MAKLKAIVHDLVEVSNDVRRFYQARADGRWEVSLDAEPPGYVKAEKLDEFRDNNRALFASKTELEAKLKAFEGVDPEEYKALKSRPDLTPRVTELEARLASAQRSADSAVFRTKVADAFLTVGGRPEALDFIITKAQGTFTLANGALVTQEFSTERPGEPLSLTEWVGARVLDSAFAFMPSGGGGASNHGGGRTSTARTISRDPVEFGRNIESIAKGVVTVS